jgi:hypothetical protein
MSIYLRAAERIALTAEEWNSDKNKRGACCVALTSEDATHMERVNFAGMFKPDDAGPYWWREAWSTVPDSWCDQQARILALLFMHWMTKPSGWKESNE